MVAVNGDPSLRGGSGVSSSTHDAPADADRPDLGPLSPELVLVDPELAARARSLLPYPPPAAPRVEAVVQAGARGRRTPVVVAGAAALALVLSVASGAGTSASRPSGERAAAARGVSRHVEAAPPVVRRSARAHAPSRPSATKSTVDRAARAGKKDSGATARRGSVNKPSAAVERPAAPRVRGETAIPVVRPVTATTFRWSAPSAPYFDFVLWRGTARILDLWPVEPRVTVPRSWRYAGHRYSLEPGRYLWFVYPGIGERRNGRYGPLVTSGTFVVRGGG